MACTHSSPLSSLLLCSKHEILRRQVWIHGRRPRVFSFPPESSHPLRAPVLRSSPVDQTTRYVIIKGLQRKRRARRLNPGRILKSNGHQRPEFTSRDRARGILFTKRCPALPQMPWPAQQRPVSSLFHKDTSVFFLKKIKIKPQVLKRCRKIHGFVIPQKKYINHGFVQCSAATPCEISGADATRRGKNENVGWW